MILHPYIEFASSFVLILNNFPTCRADVLCQCFTIFFFVLRTPISCHCWFEKAALKPKYKKADWSTVVLSGFQFQFWTWKKKKTIRKRKTFSPSFVSHSMSKHVSVGHFEVLKTCSCHIGSLKDGWTCQPCHQRATKQHADKLCHLWGYA